MACEPKETNTPEPEAEAQAATPTAERAPPAEPKKLHTVEGMTEWRLDNGLRVVLFPDASNEKVTVNVTYFVGSRHEGSGETGMAHLLEHMLFKGTPTHADPWKELRDHGANFNGTTWLDRTNYFETLLATEENLDWALDFEASRMRESNIAQDVLEKEFSVVRNEFEMGENSPFGVLMERMTSSAFIWHNYGKSTIGARSDIENVPAVTLRAFYDKYYQPDNAMLVVAGKFDEKAAMAKIVETFGGIPKPERELPPTYTVEPIQDGERSVTLRRTGDVGLVGAVYHTVPAAHPDFAATEALGDILTNAPSGRLYKSLVETGDAARVFGWPFPLRDPGMLYVFAQVRDAKKIDKVKDAMLEGIESVAEDGVTQAEIDRFREDWLKNFDLSLTDSQRIAIELSESAALGDWRMIFVQRDRVKELSKERVERVAKEYLKRSNRTLGVFVPTAKPDRAPQPSTPDVLALVDQYSGGEALSEGEQFVATVENVEARTTRSKLSNGMQVAVLPRETRGDAVEVRIALRYGNERSLVGKSMPAGMLFDMLMRGTKKRDRQAIQDEMARLRADVFGFSDDGIVYVSVSTLRENLGPVLDLVSEILKQPKFDKKEFELLRRGDLADLESQLKDPNAIAGTAMERTMNPFPKSDVRYVPTLAERVASLKKVKVSDVKALHSKQLGAAAGQITIVGDFDTDAITPKLEEHFGTWKAKTPYERIADRYSDVKASDDVLDTPDKEMAFVGMARNLELQDTDSDYAAMVLADFILGGGGASRLNERLRQKEGWSYGTFSGLQASAFERAGGLFIGAICAPQNAAKALGGMREEMQRVIDEGVGADELARAKQAYKLRFDGRLADDDFVAGSINGAMHEGRTMEFDATLNAAIQALTKEDLARVYKEYFAPGAFVTVIAGDQAKAKAGE
jgi:zinc protease